MCNHFYCVGDIVAASLRSVSRFLVLASYVYTARSLLAYRTCVARSVRPKQPKIGSRIGLSSARNRVVGEYGIGRAELRPVDMLCAKASIRPLAVSCTNPREYRIVPGVPH